MQRCVEVVGHEQSVVVGRTDKSSPGDMTRSATAYDAGPGLHAYTVCRRPGVQAANFARNVRLWRRIGVLKGRGHESPMSAPRRPP